jgi:hypothetical protein
MLTTSKQLTLPKRHMMEIKKQEGCNHEQELQSQIARIRSGLAAAYAGRIGVMGEEYTSPQRIAGRVGATTDRAGVRPYDDKATGRETAVESQRLIDSAEDGGFFLDDDDISAIGAAEVAKTKVGEEHTVLFVGKEPNKLVIRSTIRSNFGVPDRSPAQYLQRIEDYNSLFPKHPLVVIGVSLNNGQNPVIWTAQPFVEGEEFDSDLDLQAAMERRGWVRNGTIYRHSASGAVIYDVHPGNILHKGDELYPIDVIVGNLPSAEFSVESSGRGGHRK